MQAARRSRFDLSGLAALVTGAGRGLGRGCATALADEGAHVICAARTPAEIEAVADEIRAGGGSAEALVLDVTDRSAVRRAIGGLDRLDVLVNNAGWNNPQAVLDVDDATLDRMIDLNLTSAFVVAQAAARCMVDGGRGGSIVNMSSTMGHVGGPKRGVYCTTKHGLEGMTRAMAIDLAPHGIRVNSVCPTFVETPLTEPFFRDPAFGDWVLGNIPLGRLGTLDDVAGAVVYLASPAASFVTGSSLFVDGGWTAR